MSRRISLLSAAALVVIVAVVVIVIATSGGNNNTSHASSGAAAASTQPSGQGEVLRLSADPSGALRFMPSTLTAAKPGKVTLIMKNPSSTGMDHGISVEGNGVDSDGPIVGAGSTSTLTVTLKKGTYTFYCPVPGHRQAGMVGTLTVK